MAEPVVMDPSDRMVEIDSDNGMAGPQQQRLQWDVDPRYQTGLNLTRSFVLYL